MPNINFTTSKGTKYILSFDQLDTPENIEVSFKTKDQEYEATNKGEVFEVMQIITGKVKQFLEKFKEKYPKKLNDFELYINPISEESEGDLGSTEKNKRTQLYLRYINKNLNPEEYRVEVMDNIMAIYYNTPSDINYKIAQIGKSPNGASYRIDYNKGSKNIDDIWIMYQDLDKDTINFIKNYKNDIESLKQELTSKGLKISNTSI
jgi:hypothetical protein